MPSSSKQQQKFMGIVHAIQKGDIDPSDVSPEAQKVAQDMNPSDVKDFASTKHKGLPKKVKQEILNKLKEYAMTLPGHHAKSAAPMEPLRSDYEMDLQEDRIPQNFNVGTTRDYHTKLATTPRKKYDKTNFNPAHSGQEDLQESDDKLEMLKLFNKALRIMPGSQKQKEIIKQLNVIRTRNGLKSLDEKKVVNKIAEYASVLDLSYIQNKDAKLNGTPKEKDAINREVKSVKESVNEVSPNTIHKLADKKGIKWDNEPSFLRLTKQLTGKEHLDDLTHEELIKVKQYLEKQSSETSLKETSPCWDGYKQVGMKTKGGRQVPNCVKESVNEAAMNPVKKVVNAILKKHNVQAMKTYASSVRGAHNIINGGYRWEGDWHLGFYGNVPQDVVEKVAAEMEKAGVKYVKVKKGHISADFSKTGLSEATLNELKLNDLVGNQYKYVIGSGEEKSLGTNDKKYVLEMIAKALETYLYDHNFALNYLEGSQRKQYELFFEKEVLKPMLTKIDFTLNNFFTLDKDKVKWNLSSNDTRKMMDEIFRKNSKIPADIKREYYDYRLDYAGVKLKESVKTSTKRDYKAEYKKFQSSTESKKYRAELNKYNRDNGTYGNGDGKDASHVNGKIVGFEDESVNRGRAEKSRLKKESVNEELSFDEKEMVVGIIEILKQVEDPRNRMKIALNMLKKFKEEDIEFDYQKFVDALKEYSMGSYEYDKGSRELGESMIKSMKDVVYKLLPTNTLARHASDPNKNKEFVDKIIRELGSLLNRFYKQNNIDLVLR